MQLNGREGAIDFRMGKGGNLIIQQVIQPEHVDRHGAVRPATVLDARGSGLLGNGRAAPAPLDRNY